MRPLSELHVSSRTIYVSNTDMTVSFADFTAISQVLKEVKAVINQVTLRAAATVSGESGILVVRGGKIL